MRKVGRNPTPPNLSRRRLAKAEAYVAAGCLAILKLRARARQSAAAAAEPATADARQLNPDSEVEPLKSKGNAHNIFVAPPNFGEVGRC
jgi:hypothetical protein